MSVGVIPKISTLWVGEDFTLGSWKVSINCGQLFNSSLTMPVVFIDNQLLDCCGGVPELQVYIS